MTEREIAIGAFLNRYGFGGARREPLAGDASVRRYERLSGGPWPAMLMDAPPDQLDVRPFLRVGAWLRAQGLSAPAVLAAEPESGLILLEDLGDRLFNRELGGGADEVALYGAAVDLLVVLHTRPPPDALPPYDEAKLLAEAKLLLDWFATGLDFGAQSAWPKIWRELLPAAQVGPDALVYVDYHADNLLWLPERSGLARIGLLDFQDARLGPSAYDVASLLEDARRDVAPALADAMLTRYLAARPGLDPAAFRTACAILGAQRNCKILGLFTRLARRDGKPQYLAHLPRVQAYLRRDLRHPALAPLAAWFERYLPLNVAT